MSQSEKPTHFTHPKTGAAVEYGAGAICTTVAAILEEVRRARGMFPGANNNFAALIEEVGELAQAFLDHSFGKASEADIFKEAVQVAAMAIRVLEEGTPEFPYRGPMSLSRELDVDGVVTEATRRIFERGGGAITEAQAREFAIVTLVAEEQAMESAGIIDQAASEADYEADDHDTEESEAD